MKKVIFIIYSFIIVLSACTEKDQTSSSKNRSILAPSFSITQGTYNHDLIVTLACSTTDAIIHYSTNGTDPNSSSKIFTMESPIEISGHGTNITIKAIAIKNNSSSQISLSNYIINYDQAVSPVFSNTGGIVTSAQTVAITTTTADSEILYTTDGTNPASSNTAIVYFDEITIAETATLKAITRKDGMQDSAITETIFTFQVATPIFTLNQNPVSSGFYDVQQDVEISCDTPGATIIYTTTGDIPGDNNLIDRDEIYYENPISIFNFYLKAIATMDGMQNSVVQTLYIRQQDFPEIVSITPENPNITVGESFNLEYSIADNDGFADINTSRISIRAEGHGTTNLTSDVLVFRYNSGNSFLVANWNFDTDTAEWITGNFGEDNIIETNNAIIDTSQCTINSSGNNITVNYNISPKAAFNAVSNTKYIWVWVQDKHLNTESKYDHNVVSEMGTLQLITE